MRSAEDLYHFGFKQAYPSSKFLFEKSEVKLFLDDLKDDVVNVKANNNIKQSYNFMIS